MFGIFPLMPAYGRDYKSKAEVIAALKSGDDFKTANGSYCSLRDFPNQEITVRYKKLTQVCIVKSKELA